MEGCSDISPNSQGQDDKQLHRGPGRCIFNKIKMGTKLMILKISTQSWNWEFDVPVEELLYLWAKASPQLSFCNQRMKNYPGKAWMFQRLRNLNPKGRKEKREEGYKGKGKGKNPQIFLNFFQCDQILVLHPLRSPSSDRAPWMPQIIESRLMGCLGWGEHT